MIVRSKALESESEALVQHERNSKASMAKKQHQSLSLKLH